jgi:hypothetical protein
MPLAHSAQALTSTSGSGESEEEEVELDEDALAALMAEYDEDDDSAGGAGSRRSRRGGVLNSARWWEAAVAELEAIPDDGDDEEEEEGELQGGCGSGGDHGRFDWRRRASHGCRLHLTHAGCTSEGGTQIKGRSNTSIAWCCCLMRSADTSSSPSGRRAGLVGGQRRSRSSTSDKKVVVSATVEDILKRPRLDMAFGNIEEDEDEEGEEEYYEEEEAQQVDRRAGKAEMPRSSPRSKLKQVAGEDAQGQGQEEEAEEGDGGQQPVKPARGAGRNVTVRPRGGGLLGRRRLAQARTSEEDAE